MLLNYNQVVGKIQNNQEVLMLRIGIIIGSTRPKRVGENVARWVFDNVKKRSEASFELVDLKDFNLPLLDESIPPAMSQDYEHEHTKRWSKKIESYDAFIFVTPEYNHGTSAALKNAIDFLYQEWNNKVAGFVAYGSAGGTRAVENLRLIMGEVQVATIRTQLAFSLRTDFENFQIFRPADYHQQTLDELIDQLLLWATALKAVRHNRIQIDSDLEKESSRPVQ
jgi:NAD(P)H-dependent FMN reductase